MKPAVLKNRVVKNAGWMIVGKIFQMVLNLIVGVLTARYLGPSNYGLINYAGAYTALFMSFCTLGINSVIVKEFVECARHEGEIVGTALGLRGISSALSAIAIVGISTFVDRNEPLTIWVVALCSIGVIFHVFDTFQYWFQSRLESKKTAIASLIAYTVMTIYRVVLLISSSSVEWFALSTSIDYICIAILLFYLYKKSGGSKLAFSWEYGKELLKKSYHFILPGLMVAIYGQTDKIMLKHMMGETDVGYYATAVSLSSVWCFVLGAIIDSMAPIIMQAHKENTRRFEKMNRILYCIVFYISAFVSILFLFFGEMAIHILYGDPYIPAIAPLKIITWYTAFSYLGVARNVWIVSENRQKYLKYIYFSAAIFNVILNLLLIPVWGTVGAAVASLCAQIITTIIVPFFIKEMRKNSIMMLESIAFRFEGVFSKNKNDCNGD